MLNFVCGSVKTSFLPQAWWWLHHSLHFIRKQDEQAREIESLLPCVSSFLLGNRGTLNVHFGSYLLLLWKPKWFSEQCSKIGYSQFWEKSSMASKHTYPAISVGVCSLHTDLGMHPPYTQWAYYEANGLASWHRFIGNFTMGIAWLTWQLCWD